MLNSLRTPANSTLQIRDLGEGKFFEVEGEDMRGELHISTCQQGQGV